MRVDIWSDLVCPWCYIGKRRFETALAAFPHRAGITIVHRSFQLDPTVPRGAVFDHREVLAKKYGLSPEQAEAMRARMRQIAADVGLSFRESGVTGNTRDAHGLVHFAAAHGRQDAMIERLYRAHFSEGRSIFARESLAELAGDAGCDPAEAVRVLEEDRHGPAVDADIADARALNVTGVPFFLIDGSFGVSGAQSSAVFEDTLGRAWAAQATQPVSTSPQ